MAAQSPAAKIDRAQPPAEEINKAPPQTEPAQGAAVLVVGATGILRPAVGTLLARGVCVLAVARDGDRLMRLADSTHGRPDQLLTLAYDAADASFPVAVEASLTAAGLRLDTAVTYSPASRREVLDELAATAPGGLVEILTSNVAAPRGSDRSWQLADLPPGSPRWRRLVLGWHRQVCGSRWHTPDEVSSAALHALDSAGDHLLGVVSPWEDGPG